MTIERFENGPRFCRVLRHNGTVYLAGLTADDLSGDTTAQTREILAKIDACLAKAGSDKIETAQRRHLAARHRRLRQDERSLGRLDRQVGHAGACHDRSPPCRGPVPRRDHGDGGERLGKAVASAKRPRGFDRLTMRATGMLRPCHLQT